ncbi:MAG: ATP-binding protein, partial [Thermodesulfobacteriota bacterium]|nr:ATP-binding protein [Thermodesulfobacteriota bacterium]
CLLKVYSMMDQPPIKKTQNVEHQGNDFLCPPRPETDEIQALLIIFRMAEAVSQCISHEEICKCIIDIFIEDTDFENASILLYDTKKDCLRLTAAKGFSEILGISHKQSYHDNLIFERDEGIAWKVFGSQTPMFIENSAKKSIPVKPGSKVLPCSLVCLPLWSIGVFNLSSQAPRTFSPCKRRDLVILSNVIGRLLQTTEFHEKLYASHLHLQELVETKNSELHHVKKELSGAMAYMESAIENVPQGVCLLDSAGNMLHANPVFFSIAGCSLEYIAGNSPVKLFQDKTDYADLRNLLLTGGLAKLTDIDLLRPDKTTLPADIFLHPLRDPEGRNQGSMLVVHDLTNQKIATEKLIYIEKLRALGSMAGGIAHDFNNLLTTILGNAQLLAMGINDQGALRKVSNIETAVNDGAFTVSRLQTFTGFGQKLKTRGQASNVDEVVKDAIELTRPKWKDESEKNGIFINTKLDLHDTRSVSMHPAELREILTNLIFNAVDAMPEGGTITMRSYEKASNVVLEIEDDGIGMSKDIKKRVFNPYFTTKDIGNSGLGLSVSFGLIVQAKGTVSVDSKEGKGTTFMIILPISGTQEVSKAPTAENSETQPLKILAVDDEKQIVDLLTIMLDGLGHKIVGVSDGQHAIDFLDKEDFDLVITDLGMPMISGWDIAAKAKSRKAGLPVILITGWGAEYESKDLTGVGIDAVLSKPFRLDELKNIISEQCAEIN